VSGFAAERNRWNVGLGLQYKISPVSSGFVEYRGDIGSDDRAHSLNVGLRLGWGGTPAVAMARAAPMAVASASVGDPAASAGDPAASGAGANRAGDAARSAGTAAGAGT
ncbi:autotransporter outer membrane beta-barrel domain-containing protein, partial [Lysobacter sp. 2RAB21]